MRLIQGPWGPWSQSAWRTGVLPQAGGRHGCHSGSRAIHISQWPRLAQAQSISKRYKGYQPISLPWHSLQAVAAVLVDPQSEEQAAYRCKMGRWRKETSTTIHDNDFWLAMRVFAASHKPLEHALNFIHSTSHSHKYALWVCGKSADVLAEFDSLLSSPIWCVEVAEAGGENMHSLLELGVGLILLQHSSFQRRVHDLVTSFPSKAMWLVHKPAHTACAVRKQVASEILASRERNMEKLRAACAADLRYTSQTGRCKPFLYNLLRTWYEASPSDVGINETHNSYIRRECERNRHICLPLLSSRCNARYDLKLTDAVSQAGTAKSTATRRWSRLRPMAFRVLQAQMLCKCSAVKWL